MTASKTVLMERRQAFRDLHASGTFVIPNPWDIGGARYLQGLGFKSLATTSAGASWSLGRQDGALELGDVIEHIRMMAEATGLPLNADLESGFSQDAAGVARSVALAIDAGAAAISIEDSSGIASNPVRTIESSIERLKAARAAIDSHAPDVMLVGRAENFFVGRPDLENTILRLKAYSEAGADVLYAPGIATRAQIAAVVAAVAPKPVNLLIGGDSALMVADAAALGVRRISVGGALARAAWGGFMEAARSIAEQGKFAFPQAADGKELNAFFGLAGESLTSTAAEVVGQVEYRNGEGPLFAVRKGLVQVEFSPGDATLAWQDGSYRNEIAMPFANFCRYLSNGAIVLRR